MKKQTTETLKIVAGILIGTAVVMGVIGFMLTMLWHIFIIPVLMVLFVVSIIVVGMFMGYKESIVVISSFIFGIWGFNPYYKHACGPNSADVKVMKPMAEKISAYIVKHGIPKSLKDIPDLPYGLEGCERDAEFDYQENCKFENKMINLFFRHGKYTIDNKIYEEASLEMRHVVNNTTETGLLMEFKKKNNNFLQIDKIKIYSGKSSGICKSWRQ